MNTTEMHEAINDASATLGNADRVVWLLADMLIGRLRMCKKDTLCKLKNELQQFNANKKQWKN